MEEAAAMERQLNLDMNNNNNNTSINNNATTTATHDLMQQLIHDQNQMLAFEDHPPTADILNLFHLPRSSVMSSLLPNSSPMSFTAERESRKHLNDKFKALRNLIPNPSKADRASVVGDAINYIYELVRIVNELTILVEKKRCGKLQIQQKLQTQQKLHKYNHIISKL